MRLPLVSALLFVLLPACSDGTSESNAPAQQQDAAAEAQDDAAEPQEAEADSAAEAQAEAEAGPPGGLDQVLGIWAKRVVGDAMILENTCGNFYLIDFDFKHTRLSKAGPSTLKMEYCKDATCAAVEEGVDKTFEFAAGKATFSKTDPMKLDATCELTVQDDGTIAFDTPDHGLFTWKAGLTYKGSGCAPYKDPKMTGDTCEAIAESEIDRVP